MLDQLIESREHLKENHRRGNFLLTTFTAVVSLFSAAIIYSLFSYNIAMAGEKLDLSSLASPINIPAVTPPPPPPPQPEIEQIKQISAKPSDTKRETRAVNMLRPDELPNKPPDSIFVVKSSNLARPNAPFELSTVDSTQSSSGSDRKAQNTVGENRPLEIKPQNNSKEIDKEIPPVMKTPTPKPATTVHPIIRSGRVLNGQAKDLVKPPYPASAKAVYASGAVNVQVTIDENGNVISANAVSGHPLLRQVSEQAARASKFSPTFIGDQKVKVTGVIVYNFIAP